MPDGTRRIGRRPEGQARLSGHAGAGSPPRPPRLLQAPGGEDLHRVAGHILVHATVAGGHLGDLIDHAHAAHHLAEHGVAEVPRTMVEEIVVAVVDEELAGGRVADLGDRKSTRLNSSHVKISYAVFCLKKK